MAIRIPRVFRFSLRLLLLAVAIFTTWLAVRTNQARRQHRVVITVQGWGASVKYDYQYDANGSFQKDAKLPGPAWLRQLAGDDFFISIASISFTGDRITDAQFQSLINDLAALPDLRHLNFWHADLSERSLELVGQRLQRLHSLHIPSDQIADEHLVHVQALSELRTLGLWDTSVTGSGLAHLSRLPKLDELLLQRSEVTDEGLESIAGLTNLRRLSLSGNRGLTDAALTPIANLRQLERLSVMNCSGLTDDCLVYLEGLTNLTYFQTAGSRVSDEGFDSLKRKIPNLK